MNMHLRALGKRLKHQDIRLSGTEEVIDQLAEGGFDPQFGARPIKRMIQRNVLNELSKELLVRQGEKRRGNRAGHF